MRLVMGGEALQGPLTGIGQYTYELARALREHPDLESFEFLVDGFLRSAPVVMNACTARLQDNPAGATQSPARHPLGALRAAAVKSPALVRLYGALTPALSRIALRAYGTDDVFHSPNYFLPEFPGRRIVSILDLSTFRYPEHHRAEQARFVNRNIERAVRDADRIITISQTVKNEILERFAVPEARIVVTHLGARDSFHPRAATHFAPVTDELGLPYKEYFAFVSTIEPRKNLERLLDAYMAYREANASDALPLIVAGSAGWKSEGTHRRLRELQARGCVRYLGYTPQTLLPVILSGARALLYPSLYEGFGLPVLEAMQSGTAVLTSRGTAMEEIAGDAALRVDPTDVDEMRHAIEHLANDPAAAQTRARLGLERAAAYSWDRCARETFAAYRP